MNHTIEIPKEIFNKLVSINHMPTKVDDGELARKTYFNVLDVNLMQIENHVSSVTQYYIQDINA